MSILHYDRLRGEPNHTTILIKQFHGDQIIRRKSQFPISIAAHHHETHLAVFIQP